MVLIEIAQLSQCLGSVGIVFAKALGSSLQQRNNFFFVSIVAQALRNMIPCMSHHQSLIRHNAVMLRFFKQAHSLHLIA